MKTNYLKIDNYFYVYLFLITFFSIFSQYLFKVIQKNNNNKNNKNNSYNNLYLGLGLVMYTVLGYCIYKLLSYGNILILNIIWHLIYFAVLFLMGYLLFQEKINFQKIVAIFFGFISLVIFMIYGVE